MKPLVLQLVTPSGHELGLLPLPDVQVAAAGECADGGCQLPVRQLVSVLARIRTMLAAEEMVLGLDDLDLQIAVSRALLKPSDDDQVVIRIPVSEGTSPLKKRRVPDTKTDEDRDLLRGLFDLDDLNDFEEVAH